ncbi:MAG: glycosyltransferase family 39 protein, partial [Acidobacteriota bacterium]
MSARSPASRRPWLGLLFVIVLVIYAKGKVATSFDSGYSIHLAVSLLEEGNLDLEEYRDVIPPGDYRTLEVDGVLHSRYPVGPSVVAAPLVAAVESVGKYLFRIWDFDAFIRSEPPASVERFIGSFFTALAAVVMFYIARLRVGDGGSAAMLLIFAFCTSAWSVSSRALWQHGPSMLFLAATLYVLMRAREKEPGVAQVAGLFLALAFAMRPTNALAVALLTLYVAKAHTWKPTKGTATTPAQAKNRHSCPVCALA